MAGRGEAGSTIAERYAGALFELARSQNNIAEVERGLDRFQAALQTSAELRTLVRSPVISSSEQRAGLTAVLKRLGLSGLVHDFLLTVSRNRRLYAVDNIIKAFKQLSSRERGEVEAQVISAIPLTDAQRQDLVDMLRQRLGKTPKMTQTIDPSLLGGLVVRIGSEMIDASLRTKLKSLELAMKEAG